MSVSCDKSHSADFVEGLFADNATRCGLSSSHQRTPLFESACHQENMADAERPQPAHHPSDADGLENTTFSPQAIGKRLVVGNRSSR